jgi:hypothetical protein
MFAGRFESALGTPAVMHEVAFYAETALRQFVDFAAFGLTIAQYFRAVFVCAWLISTMAAELVCFHTRQLTGSVIRRQLVSQLFALVL